MIGRDMGGLLQLLPIAVIGLLAGLILPDIRSIGLIAWFCIAMLTGLLGIGLLVYARMPLYRQGKFLSIGPKELPANRLPAYKWAWRLIGGAIVVQLAMLLIKGTHHDAW